MAHPRMYDDADPLLGRVRACCAALPQALEFESHGRPNFRAGSRRVFAVYGSRPTGTGPRCARTLGKLKRDAER